MQNTVIQRTKKSLKRNGFVVFVCEDAKEAKDVFAQKILPNMEIKSASYADSLTVAETGILEILKKKKGIKFLDTFSKTKTWDEKIQLRRKALLVDLFISGSNAITEDGQIINLDMIGNRINGIVFGPKEVVLVAGKNKIVRNLDDGMKKVKEITAVKNAIRHAHFSLPCQKTGRCMNCSNEKRICNIWSIIEKCYPKNRIKIIIINQDVGL